MNFLRIKKNYEDKLWTKSMVQKAVSKGIITKEEYLLITKEPYKEELA